MWHVAAVVVLAGDLVATAVLLANRSLPQEVVVGYTDVPDGVLIGTALLALGSVLALLFTRRLRRWSGQAVRTVWWLLAWGALGSLLSTFCVLFPAAGHVIPLVVVDRRAFIEWSSVASAGLVVLYGVLVLAVILWRNRVARWIAAAAAMFGLGYADPWTYGLIVPVVGAALVAITWWNPRHLGATVTRFWAHRRLVGVRAGATGRSAALTLALSLVVAPLAFSIAGGVVANLPSRVELTGYASLGTPLVHATVTVYPIDANGQRGPALAVGKTNLDGYYRISVARGSDEPLLAVTTGGTYVDVVSKRPERTQRGDSLESVFSGGDNESSLNPLTTIATRRVLVLVHAGKPVDLSTMVAFNAVAHEFDLPSITDLYPATIDVAGYDQPVDPSYADRELGLILAGFDDEADGLHVSSFDLTQAIGTDLSDGNLNGRDGDTPVRLPGSRAFLPKNVLTSRLQRDIRDVADSPENLTDVGAPVISPLPCTIYVLLGELYVATPMAINFIDGQWGQAAFSAVDGQRPFTCRVTSGTLDPPFTLLSNCRLIYNGRPIVVGDSPAYHSFPFSVTITDASHPRKSAVVGNVRITVLHTPPTIRTQNATCPGPGLPCPIQQIATASGGVAPYTFDKGFGTVGTGLPFGFQVLTYNDGTIHGYFGDLEGTRGMLRLHLSRGFPNSPQSGTYTFQVCVTDSIGASACGWSRVTVKSPNTGPPTSPWDGSYGMTFHWLCYPGTVPSNVADPNCSMLENQFTTALTVSGGQLQALGGGTVAISASGAASYSYPFTDASGYTATLIAHLTFQRHPGAATTVSGTYSITAPASWSGYTLINSAYCQSYDEEFGSYPAWCYVSGSQSGTVTVTATVSGHD